jgi:hypothetical protein
VRRRCLEERVWHPLIQQVGQSARPQLRHRIAPGRWARCELRYRNTAPRAILVRVSRRCALDADVPRSGDAQAVEQGIVAERVMTDNAFARTQNRSFRELLGRRAGRHIRTRPFTPRTNGRVERCHQTLMCECAYALKYTSGEGRLLACHTGSTTTTERRTHTALGNTAPRRVRDRARQLERGPCQGVWWTKKGSIDTGTGVELSFRSSVWVVQLALRW